jgi:hypothetical protein
MEWCHGGKVKKITDSNLIEGSYIETFLNSPEASVRETAPRGAGVPFKSNSSEDMVDDGDDPKDYL